MTHRFIKRGVHSGKETCEKMRHYINVHHPCHTPLMEACLLTPHSYTNECRCHTNEWVTNECRMSVDVTHTNESRMSVEWVSMSHIRMSVDKYAWFICVTWLIHTRDMWLIMCLRNEVHSDIMSFFLSFFLSFFGFLFLFSWMLKTWLNYLVIPRQVTLAQLLAVVSAPKGQNSPQCF